MNANSLLDELSVLIENAQSGLFPCNKIDPDGDACGAHCTDEADMCPACRGLVQLDRAFANLEISLDLSTLKGA